MKKILILVDKKGKKRAEFVSLLSSYFAKETEISLHTFNSLLFDISEKGTKVYARETPITDFDLVYVRRCGKLYAGTAGVLGLCLKFLNVPFIDTILDENGVWSLKVASLIKLNAAGVAIPKTVFFVKPSIEKHYDYLVKSLGLPFVAKDVLIQRGDGVFLINSLDDLQKLPRANQSVAKNRYLFQQFIEKEHEYRILALGDTVGVWYEKFQENKDEFRYNTAVGAREEYLNKDETPESISGPALLAAKSVKIQVAGVDIVVEKGTGRVYILEVNRGPGLSIYETESPEYRAVAEYLEGEVWNGEK
jgi:D-alanine-D-alanine ligase-like ATP-grasp enzyme